MDEYIKYTWKKQKNKWYVYFENEKISKGFDTEDEAIDYIADLIG